MTSLLFRFKKLSSIEEAITWAQLWPPEFIPLNPLWIPIPSATQPQRPLLLAKSLQSVWGGDILELFSLTHYKPQKFKTKVERQQERLVIHRPLRELPNHRHWLVFDDIMSTGSTMREALSKLQQLGIRKKTLTGLVWFYRIPHVLPNDPIDG